MGNREPPVAGHGSCAYAWFGRTVNSGVGVNTVNLWQMESRWASGRILSVKDWFGHWVDGRQLGLSVSAISQSVERGKRVATEENYSLDEIKL